MAKTVATLQREHRSSGAGNGKTVFGGNMDLIRSLKVRLEVVVGECDMKVSELFDLHESSVVTLDRDVSAPVDVLLDGRRVARGTLVAVDDNFGVRITEIEP